MTTCQPDHFQGIRFYDGTSFGYLRLFTDHVELLVGQNYSYVLDGTVQHTYRITAQGKNINLYVDGAVAITAPGAFTQKTSQKLIEIGNVGGTQQSAGSVWETFKFSTSGSYSPGQTNEYVLSEIMTLPGGAIGAMRAYDGNLYVSFNPDDPEESSSIYRFQEGFTPEKRSVLAVTKSNITSVVIDPNRNTNVFGTSGKFLGTDRGLQYLLGSKPDPFDVATKMVQFPETSGWTLSSSCVGNDRSIFNGVLTIDTRDEPAAAFLEYTQSSSGAWGAANNANGWTIEARVRITNDGGATTSNFSTLYTPRDYAFVVDASYAMSSGDNLAYAQRLLSLFISAAHTGDTITVISYGAGGLSYWSPTLQQADAQQVASAKSFVASISPAGTAPLLAALQAALQLNFSQASSGNADDNSGGQSDIILIGSGADDDSDITQVAGIVTAANARQVTIHTIGLGVFDVLPGSKQAFVDLAARNSGLSFFVGENDNVDGDALDIWQSIAPDYFDWLTVSGATGTTAQSAFIAGGSDCNPANPSATPASPAVPPDDGINAPGILFNDGTYQEVVQFFSNGVRLKYAQAYAPLPLSEQFYTVRIVARGTAIAVYAKADSDSYFKRLIYAPSGLFVRATNVGNQEAPDLKVDRFGVPHMVWQDSKDGYWAVYYAKGTAANILSSGQCYTGSSAAALTLLGSRVAFGLPASNATSIPKNAIIDANGTFLQQGVAAGDIVALANTKDSLGNLILTNTKYTVDKVIDDAVLVLETAEDLTSIWTTADYMIYNGPEDWTIPTLVSAQPLDSTEPSVLTHSDGDVYAAYVNISEGYRDVYLRHGTYGPFSTAWQETLQLTHGSGIAYSPKMVEQPDGSILVVWESARLDRTRSQILCAVVKTQDFGTVECETITSLTPNSSKAMHACVTMTTAGPVIFYEDDNPAVIGKREIYYVQVGGTPTMVSSSSGNSTNPTAASCGGMVVAAWEDDSTAIKEIVAITGTASSAALTFGVPQMITSSRGSSESPAASCDSFGNIWVAFHDDRVRAGTPEIYVAKYDAMTDLWQSSGEDGIDTLIDAPTGFAKNPVIVTDKFRKSIIAFDGTSGTLTAVSTVDYDNSSTFNESVSAYFPLNDDSTGVTVENEIDSTANGSASNATSMLSIPTLNPGATLYNPALKSSLDINTNGLNFSIPTSVLSPTGAVDLWFIPHWASTDQTQHVIFGNSAPGSATPNTMSLSFNATAEGNSLDFSIVDDQGLPRTVSIPNSFAAPSFSWAPETPVHVRATWDEASIGVSTLYGLSFLSTAAGLAVGPFGSIYATADGGQTWTRRTSGLTYDLYSVDFAPDGTAYVCGEMGTVLFSPDGGTSWVDRSVTTSSDMTSVFYDSVASALYAVGTGGVAVKSTDQGVTWTPLITYAFNDFTSVSVLDNGTVRALVAVGKNGQIMRSTDGGATFAIVALGTASNINAISRSHEVGANVDYIVGDSGLIMSSADAGATWTSVSFTWSSGVSPYLYGVSHAADSSVVYVVGQSASFAKSMDGGATWTESKTALVRGSYKAIDAWMGEDGGGSDVAMVGTGGSVMVSHDNGDTQDYYAASANSLSLFLNGVPLPQTRANDGPFTWHPSSTPNLYFGDWQPGGSATANAAFDELIVYSDIPDGSSIRRLTLSSHQFSSTAQVLTSSALKRIEWGNISQYAKARSHWTDFDISFCGSREPTQTFQWTAQLGMLDDVIRDIAADGSGFLWMATENGVCRFDISQANDDITDWLSGKPLVPNSNSRFINYSNIFDGFVSDNTSSICVDGDGNIWIGSDSGLMMIQAATGSFEAVGIDPVQQAAGNTASGVTAVAVQVFDSSSYPFPSDNVLTVRAYQNMIFVGTDAGLVVLTNANSSFASGYAAAPAAGVGATAGPGNPSSASAATPSQAAVTAAVYTTKDGLPSNRIQALAYDDSTSEILVGTDQGLVRVSSNGQVINYNASSRLIDNDVFSITVDQSGVKYVGTGSGLTVINGTDWTSYPPSSGVGFGAIVGADVDPGGTVWMATSTGLVEFNQLCSRFSLYNTNDGLVGDPYLADFKMYRILGDDIPGNGCEKALVLVSVNGTQLTEGYEVDTHVPWVIFDTPLSASDNVEVVVHEGWRKVYDFDEGSLDPKQYAEAETQSLDFVLYRRRFSQGTVTLGGNEADGASADAAMYFVLVATLSGPSPSVSDIAQPAGATFVQSMAPGASVYTDATEQLTLLPNDIGPVSAVIMPSADADDGTDGYLQFTLQSDCIVYVAYDASSTALPGWLGSFEPVPSVYRITDMEVFTDAAGEEKLFVSVSGTNGCVYDVLSSPDACDVSSTIAVDALPPTGCATVARVNSTTSVSLAISATDPISGVTLMQISARPDFTTDGSTPVPWVPYATSYVYQVPPASTTNISVVTTFTQGTPSVFYVWGTTALIGTSNPGQIYSLDPSTGALTFVVDTLEQEVDSLCSFGSLLLIGTGVNGRAFSWDGTNLTLLGVPGGTRVPAIGVYNNTAFFGTSPGGAMYSMDSTGDIQLFLQTHETEINGFAIFGGELFWCTGNVGVQDGDLLGTTVTEDHRHAITVSGATSLGGVNGVTTVVQNHSHTVVNGVLLPAADGHTHILEGSQSGKIFQYDLASGNSIIVYADTDYRIESIASSSLDTTGLLFAGTFPNGNIVRYVPATGVFVSSFKTGASGVVSMKVVQSLMNAAAGTSIYAFDGVKWQYITGAVSPIADFIGVAAGVDMLVGNQVLQNAVTTSQAIPDTSICAYVRFQDAAGNISSIYDANGDIIKCYNPCVTITNGEVNGVAISPNVHRITEVNYLNATAVSVFNGDNAFLSGNKVEVEVGVYESEILNGTDSLVQWVSLSWIGSAPANTSITVAVRSAATAATVSAAVYGPEFTNPTANDLTNQTGQYLQFRATLTVTVSGAPSPELYQVGIQLRTSQAVHFFTTNFALPDALMQGILTYNGCVNPPVTDLVFAISGLNSVDFADYFPIVPNQVFEVPSQHQTNNLKVGIKLISSPSSVPVVDEFALLVALANDATILLNAANMPVTTGTVTPPGSTRTVLTDEVQGHVHTVTFASNITNQGSINGMTSMNAGHMHNIVAGIVQIAAGHTHVFSI